jgi:hypothetical protein
MFIVCKKGRRPLHRRYEEVNFFPYTLPVEDALIVEYSLARTDVLPVGGYPDILEEEPLLKNCFERDSLIVGKDLLDTLRFCWIPSSLNESVFYDLEETVVEDIKVLKLAPSSDDSTVYCDADQRTSITEDMEFEMVIACPLDKL